MICFHAQAPPESAEGEMGILGCLATFHSIWQRRGDQLELQSLISGLESKPQGYNLSSLPHTLSPVSPPRLSQKVT